MALQPAMAPSITADVKPVPSMIVASSISEPQQSTEGSHEVNEVLNGRFTCFPRLPLELRRKIIKEACKVARILNVLANSYPLTGIPSSVVNLAVLYVSSEIRATALEVLKPVFSLHIRARYDHDRRSTLSSFKDMHGTVLVSPNNVLYFNSNSADSNFKAATATLTFRNGRSCLNVTSIAFNTTVLKDIQFGAYKWLKVLAWTYPSTKFILVDRLAPPLDNFLPDTMKADDEEEDSNSYSQLGYSQSQRATHIEAEGPLEFIDLGEGTYTELDDEMMDAIAKLAIRPSDLTVWGVLGFDVPVTKKANFKIPIFKRMGLTRGGIRI